MTVAATVSLLPLCAAVFLLDMALVLGRRTDFVDRPVLTGAVASRHQALDGLMTFATDNSKVPLIIVSVLATALLGLRARSWRPVLLVGGAGALSVAAATLVKELTDRTRPPASFWAVPESGFCFPSRHTTIAVAVLLVLAYVFAGHLRARSRAAALAVWAGALGLALLVGVSRVYLGVHWATDVLGGFALGAVVALLLIVPDTVRRHRGRQRPWRRGADWSRSTLPPVP
ncbi:phosphatase PAP2 family protein [Streptomyces sp. NPDC054796]